MNIFIIVRGGRDRFVRGSFGLGGIFTEIMGDVSLRRAPVSEATALEMIDELKGRALFEGARGAKPVDKGMIAKAISQLSVFAAAR